MTELTSEVAKVPRNSKGERIGERRVIEVDGAEFDVWIVPMSIGDQFEFNESDTNLNDFTDFDNVFEMYDEFLGDKTKAELSSGDTFTKDDLRDVRLPFGLALMEEISRAAGVDMDEETLDELEDTLEAEAGNL